jgi:elongation factor 3
MIQCIADPTQVPECVYKLAATTFVTQVEAPALAIMMPLLGRGLNEPNTAVKRQTAVIIENMCKLVMEPSEAEFFIPKLLPGLDRIIEIGADPELRSVAERARKTLLRAAGQETGNEVNESAEALRKVSAEENLIKMLKAIITEKAPKRAVSCFLFYLNIPIHRSSYVFRVN